jgi:hypothetical protein
MGLNNLEVGFSIKLKRLEAIMPFGKKEIFSKQDKKLKTFSELDKNTCNMSGYKADVMYIDKDYIIIQSPAIGLFASSYTEQQFGILLNMDTSPNIPNSLFSDFWE